MDGLLLENGEGYSFSMKTMLLAGLEYFWNRPKDLSNGMKFAVVCGCVFLCVCGVCVCVCVCVCVFHDEGECYPWWVMMSDKLKGLHITDLTFFVSGPNVHSTKRYHGGYGELIRPISMSNSSQNKVCILPSKVINTNSLSKLATVK